jgi:hypothetical protein
VASGPGQKTFWFSAIASKTVRGLVAAVHHGAGRGWRCVMRETPCRRVCTGVQEKLGVCGKAGHALHTLGGPIMSIWHGRGGAHGGSRVRATRGIGCRGQHGAGGEVTGQGMVGVALHQLGAHGGHGDALGEHGVGQTASLRGRVEQGAAITHWGSALVAVVEQKGERERFWQGLASGSPSSL